MRTNALVYLRISAIGITFQLLTFAGTGYLRGLQDTRTPLLVAIGAAVANLVIELVLDQRPRLRHRRLGAVDRDRAGRRRRSSTSG